MTLQQGKSIARHLGLTLRMVRSGDYRVNFRDGNETTAYYTDNLEDAVKTAIEMARRRVVTKVCPDCKQSPCRKLRSSRSCSCRRSASQSVPSNYPTRDNWANGVRWAG